MNKKILDWWLLSGKSTPPISAPSEQASAFDFTDVGESWIIGSVTAGDGAGRLIVYRIGSPIGAAPIDGITYSQGDEIETNTKVLVVGDETDFDLEGIAPSTTVYWRAFEYNGSGSNIKYNTDAATGNPDNQATTAVAETSITIIDGTITDNNAPNSQRQWANSSNIVPRLDLTGVTQLKISTANVTAASASANTPRMYPGFDSGSPTVHYAFGSGSGGDIIDLSSTGSKSTAYLDVTAASIAELDGTLKIWDNGGDGAADPQVNSVILTGNFVEKAVKIKAEPNTITGTATPIGEQFLTGSEADVGNVNLTHSTQVRMCIRIASGGNSSSANTPRVVPAYSLDGGSTWTKFGSGSGSEACSLSSAGTSLITDALTIPTEAKTTVRLGVISIGGDSSANFTIRSVYILYK